MELIVWLKIEVILFDLWVLIWKCVRIWFLSFHIVALKEGIKERVRESVKNLLININLKN